MVNAPPGGVLVADLLHDPEGEHLPCPAAPLLAGELVRHGVPVVTAPLPLNGPRTHHTWFDRGRLGPAGLGGASQPGAPEDLLRAAINAWAKVAGPRRILLASPRSFCAGVERAIEIVERTLETRTNPVYVRKQIVHNTYVVEDLAARGAIFVDELDEVPDGSTVVFSAHGVSPAVRTEANERGLEVIDGTCPLVTKVHAEARRYAARGDTIVLIGHAGHEEVEGTLGEAPEATILVETPADVVGLDLAGHQQVSYLTQTTLAIDETAEVIDALRTKFPRLHEPPTEDICYATTNRQHSLQAVIEESDLVLVVGSTNSSNSVRLVELSRRQGTPAQLIDRAGDIRPEWLAGVSAVGLTAGASAPPALVEEVVTALGGLGAVSRQEREVTRETVHFGLPAAVRRKGQPHDRPTP
ncbi:4-hydroxy-3-methylbut-2-enyl diphosphate reductase [Crossiella cryophila]|uniref:4-hydroxy-3-methylbut-2-enyl diphosphate reductase n=1 Tax=Crossiella cryophila TaxID=43355 RepID=A0A7W7FY50_9PSEU|nr:4-hydroxy-3-methylbut-2-enyl diphosphate reductase [Crossiella cryophila]MBB4679689.1 4-hydroxy-3-methylbut-2-enyl diphosphate reductase [Crossiella cryophila]